MDTRRAVGCLLAATLLLSACAPIASTPATASVPAASAGPAGSGGEPVGLTRTSEGGQVTVVVEWPGPEAGTVFEVALDTHSVDLDALDLTDAVLRNDRGETMAADPWAAPTGGHHRSGTLTFTGDPSSFLSGADWIELVLTGIGDLPERTLRWELRA